jgi:hypothetical protein
LDERFAGAAPRAFENQPGPISTVSKSAKYVSDAQLSFEIPTALRLPLLKSGQGLYRRFRKAYSNSKAFGA